MEVQLRWRGERWKYTSEVQNTTRMPRCWSCSGLHPSPQASQDRSPPADVLPLVTLVCLSEGSRWQYGSLPRVRWITHSDHTGAEKLAVAVLPQISLLPRHESSPENWHGPSAIAMYLQHIAAMLWSTHQHEISSYEQGCAINKTLTVSEKLFSAQLSALYCLFLFNNKNRCFLVFFSSPDVPFKMLSSVQRHCWFLESRKSCGKLAIWHWKLNFLGAQSIFFPRTHRD